MTSTQFSTLVFETPTPASPLSNKIFTPFLLPTRRHEWKPLERKFERWRKQKHSLPEEPIKVGNDCIAPEGLTSSVGQLLSGKEELARSAGGSQILFSSARQAIRRPELGAI